MDDIEGAISQDMRTLLNSREMESESCDAKGKTALGTAWLEAVRH